MDRALGALRDSFPAWWLAVTLCLAGYVQAAVPELPRPRVIGVADGLPSSYVNGIARDRAGYLWVGTSDGLYRNARRAVRMVPLASDLRARPVTAILPRPAHSQRMPRFQAGQVRGWIPASPCSEK